MRGPDRLDGPACYFRLEMRTVFENASPTLSVVAAGHFRHGDVDEAALVRIQRPELLIEPGVLRLLGEDPRHRAELDVFALAVLERVHEDALLARQRSPVRHVDDVLQRLEGLAAMPDENLRLVTAEVDARPVRRLLDVDDGVRFRARS